MPNVGSWNGKWTGESKLYAKIVNTGRVNALKQRALEVLDKKLFCYNFGDGWTARIDVREVTSKEAAKIRRKSSGFCGYDWMVNSIMTNLEIRIDN
jgi:hypothetical protein